MSGGDDMGCVHVVLVLTSMFLGITGNSCSLWGHVMVDLSGKLGTPIFEQLNQVRDILINRTGTRKIGIALDLSHNSITDFPSFTDEVFQRIVTLDLSHNDISIISARAFHHLTCLRNLSLDHNRLKCIPKDAFLKLKFMTSLQLRNNSLTDLRSGMFGSGNMLEVFDASQNNISVIGDTVFHRGLAYLGHVNLSHNSLVAFEPWPYIITPNRLYFNLQHNLISRFSNTLNWSMPHTSDYITNYDIDLQYNRLTHFSWQMFSQYIKGRRPTAYDISNMCVNVNHNPWFCDCHLYYAVKAVTKSFLAELARTYLSCDTPSMLNGLNFGYFYNHPEQLICNITEKCPPGCRCQDRPHHGYIHVDCSMTDNMTSLPTSLPPGKLFLHFPNNNIVKLDVREYMKNVTVVNVSSNRITKMYNSFLRYASNDLFIDVRNNRLKTLPTDIQNLPASSVRFQGNPIICACDTIWISDWLRRYSQNMSSHESSHYVCYYGHHHYRLVDVTSSLLMCYRDIAIGISVALGVLLVVLVTLTVVCWRYQYECKVFVYEYLHSHPFDHAPCDKGNDSTKMYDVYLSIDRENEDIRIWIKDKLLKRLERRTRHRPAYSVYYPCRQDDVGESIADQMVENINKSKRVLAVINDSYIKNGWSIEEFDHSHRLMEEANTGRLLVLIHGDLDPSTVTQEPLKTYLSQKHCLNLEDKWVWQKIRYELPHKRTSTINSASRESLTSGISSIHATLSESSDASTSLVGV